MTINMQGLQNQSRLLFAIPLKPIQGQRFQPTGFPNLGAATFNSKEGDCLLVESAQSMANRLELTIWNEAKNDVIDAVKGISHVRVMRKEGDGESFLTDSIIEAHRLNSPYILEGKDRSFFERIKEEVGAMEDGVVDRKKLTEVLLKYDVGSLLHGIFLAKKELAGGRLRLSRSISAFIEGTGVQIVASGGVKNDAVNPSGDTKKGFGNVPFSRDEFTAENITLYVNIDLAQIRGYGLGPAETEMLVAMALLKLRKLVDADLRLRTACDLVVDVKEIESSNVKGFKLPALEDLTATVKAYVEKNRSRMEVTTVQFNDKLEKSKDGGSQGAD